MVNEKSELLKILIENQEKKFSIRKLSLLRKINYKSAYNAIGKLEKEGVVTCEKLGNVINCTFNRVFTPLVFSVEYERRKKLLKRGDFRVIYSRLNELSFPFVVLLFGSALGKLGSLRRLGKPNKHSDIDLLVVAGKEKEIKQVISLMPLDIHATYVTAEEFVSMAKTKEFNVVLEAIKKNIIIIGIENYYRLLEDVG